MASPATDPRCASLCMALDQSGTCLGGHFPQSLQFYFQQYGCTHQIQAAANFDEDEHLASERTCQRVDPWPMEVHRHLRLDLAGAEFRKYMDFTLIQPN